MVQLFYYETRGKNYKKIINYEGLPFRVNLHPNEEVGSSLSCYWVIKIPWWRRTTAKILEVYGGHYRYASARVIDIDAGTIMIKGSFKPADDRSKIKQLLQYTSSPSKEEKFSAAPANDGGCSTLRKAADHGSEFQLVLTTNVTNEDFQQGYSMTGKLEQTSKHCESLTLTHFAVVKRKGY